MQNVLTALQQVLDDLLAATMPAEIPVSGAYAVDGTGTGTWSWARGKDRHTTAADPDAAWGVKTSKSGKQERYFGYELHAVVRVGRLNDDRPVACLAERIVVTHTTDHPLPSRDGSSERARSQEQVCGLRMSRPEPPARLTAALTAVTAA